VFAQNKTITGTVTDQKGETLIGVSIAVKGATTGTVSDLDGKYSLSVANTAKTLVASYMGMRTQEVAISGATIDIVMSEDFTDLDEVVVIGYGTVKKRDLTGSVSSITDKALKDIPVTSAAEAITGRLAGVSVVTSEGSPDADIRIRVRGGTSISQDNSPLYVVDGFVVSSINDIPPTDIASIDVLKDASSTAIYGAMGSNGVVLITTKSGREGKITTSFNAYWGAKKAYDFTEVLSPYEFVYYQYELDQTTSFQDRFGRFQDIGIYKSVKGNDWQDQLFGNTGFQQYYNASVSGGSKAAIFSLNLTRNDEDYIMLNSSYVRDNINFKVNTKLSNTVGLDFNVRLSNETIKGPSVSSGQGSNTKLRNAVKYPNTFGLQAFDTSLDDEDDQSGIGASSLLNNPIEEVTNEYKKQTKFNNTYNAALNWDILKSLRFSSNLSYSYLKNKTENVWLRGTGQSKNFGNQPIAKVIDYVGHRYRVSNTLTYKQKFNKIHDLNVMIGQEISESKMDTKTVEAKYFPADFTASQVLALMNNGGTVEPIKNELGEARRMLSFMGRVNYTLMDKYLFTFTARVDGASQFGPGNYWGTFPGAALAWRASEEDFLKTQQAWLDNLKVRLSYGAVGNANVAPYWRQDYLPNTSTTYYPNETTSSILYPSTTLKNNGLTWETTYSTNLGIDFGIFNSRISGTIDIYNNKTKDLIVAVPLPSTSGYAQQYQNVGETSNKGIELSLNAYIINNKDFTLSGNFNISFNKNKVEKFFGGDLKSYSSKWNGGTTQPLDDYLVEVGSPLGQMYGYVTDGMYSFEDFTWNENTKKWDLNADQPDNSAITSAGNYFGPGALKFKKTANNDTNVVGEEDKQVIGNALPKHTGGFGFNATYKGFDASIFFNWSYGNDIYNANKLDYSAYLQTRKYQNLSSDMSLANRFTTIDPLTGMNIFYGNNADPARLQELNKNATIWHPIMTTTGLHSWAVEDGSFLRLNNLTVGYTLPKRLTKKFLVESLRVYVTGYNLYCWTDYSGQDPEVSTRNESPLTPGVDYSAYPKAKSFIGGVNLTF